MLIVLIIIFKFKLDKIWGLGGENHSDAHLPSHNHTPDYYQLITSITHLIPIR